MSDSLKKDLREVAREVQELAGELRVKLHLAKLDVKSSWAELEPKLRTFKDDVERAAEDSSGQLRAAGRDLKMRLLEIKKRVAG